MRHGISGRVILCGNRTLWVDGLEITSHQKLCVLMCGRERCDVAFPAQTTLHFDVHELGGETNLNRVRVADPTIIAQGKLPATNDRESFSNA